MTSFPPAIESKLFRLYFLLSLRAQRFRFPGGPGDCSLDPEVRVQALLSDS